MKQDRIEQKKKEKNGDKCKLPHCAEHDLQINLYIRSSVKLCTL